MKKEDFCDILGDINEAYIKEAHLPRQKRKMIWVQWGAVAACIVAILAVSIPLSGRSLSEQGNTTSPSETSEAKNNAPDATAIELVVNEIDGMTTADMDVQIAYYDKLPESAWKAVLEDFHTFTGISYEDFVKRLSATLEISNFYSLATRGYKDGALEDEYRLHDYVFEGKTENDGDVTIALCSFEEPLRDCLFICDNKIPSEINGMPLVIYGAPNYYMVQFTYQNVNYDIEATNLSLDELTDLLVKLLAGTTPALSN